MKLKVEVREERLEADVSPGARLLDYLNEMKVPVNAACGGNGTCQKCRVKIQEGFAGTSAADKKAFSAAELQEGWRLSCQAKVRTSIAILVPDVESFRAKARVIKHPSVQAQSAYLSCDLGSTGVVVALGNEKGQCVVEAHLLNRQVRFGADVMSRLKVAQEQGVGLLREEIMETLRLCLLALDEASPQLYAEAKPKGLYLSGNSAMLSFLHGWSIDTLAVSPFQPAHRQLYTSHDLGLELISLPLLAGFVGADTVAGIYYLESTLKVKAPWMLVDIGTNTEIVLFTGEKYFLSSAPAGPAFEGGNIAKGMRAEPGAISEAVYRKNAWELKTIAGDKARGICGSGLLDLLHESIKAGLIHRDGYLPEGRLAITDKIALLADDVREFQLAKSATRTAVDLLIQRARLRPEKIYLAGTFAEHLKSESIWGTGLLPADIPLEAIGNASLKGTLAFASAEPTARTKHLANLEARREPIELALQDDFQSAFVDNLNF